MFAVLRATVVDQSLVFIACHVFTCVVVVRGRSEVRGVVASSIVQLPKIERRGRQQLQRPGKALARKRHGSRGVEVEVDVGPWDG